MAEALRAQELDPLSPDIVSNLAFVHLVMQQFDESIAQYQKALDLNPNVPAFSCHDSCCIHNEGHVLAGSC
jgi:tetratricopeptide (TPR) repeat protein